MPGSFLEGAHLVFDGLSLFKIAVKRPDFGSSTVIEDVANIAHEFSEWFRVVVYVEKLCRFRGPLAYVSLRSSLRDRENIFPIHLANFSGLFRCLFPPAQQGATQHDSQIWRQRVANLMA